MNANYRLKRLSTLVIVVLITASCASREAYKKGTKAEIAKDYEAALEQYRQALLEDPGNIEYKLKYEQTRFTAAFEHFQKGRRALALNELNMARAEFQRAVARATGESAKTIKRRGFSPLSFDLPDDDDDDLQPAVLDWDTRQPVPLDRLAA